MKKEGEINTNLKKQIDGLQSVIDNYTYRIVDIMDNPFAFDIQAFFRRRIKTLMAEKAELVKRI